MKSVFEQIHLFNPVSSDLKFSKCSKLTGSLCHILKETGQGEPLLQAGSDFCLSGSYVGKRWDILLGSLLYSFVLSDKSLNTSMDQLSKRWRLVKIS